MVFHLIERSWCRSGLCLALLATLLGCEVVARAALEGLHSGSRGEKALVSTPVPFERAPWVERDRIAEVALLARGEGAREVRFVRDRGLPAVSLLLFVDGAMVAEFWEGEALALWLFPGRHRLLCLMRSRPENRRPLPSETGQDSDPWIPLEVEVATGSIPCLRLAIAGNTPKLIRLEPLP